VTGGWINCVMRSFIICTVCQILLGDQIKENGMDGVYSMNGSSKNTKLQLE
jgi:hypothetical protein